jgi:catechol 2,3-dioxygenase
MTASIGTVSLGVRDLEKMTRFYQKVIGLNIVNQTSETSELGLDDITLVILQNQPGGKVYPRSPGLYHMAFLLSSRRDLGIWLNHLLANRYPLQGAGDHLVSEALYLADPEGNGIEMYADRPRDTWKYDNGEIRMDTLPLDLEALQSDAPETDFESLPSGTRMGHIHLRVDNVHKALQFYRDILGFDLMAKMPGAAFLSTGGYHHHIGVNMWQSKGASAPPSDSIGLQYFKILFPSQEVCRNILSRLEAINYPLEEMGSDTSLRDTAGNGMILSFS